jgi:hypothetical protein
MGLVVAICLLALCAVVVLVVSGPLRRRASEDPAAVGGSSTVPHADPQPAELLAAREAKYQEIRDAEMDFRTGKLSEQDFGAIDATLRAEAIEILDALDAHAAGDTVERSEPPPS